MEAPAHVDNATPPKLVSCLPKDTLPVHVSGEIAKFAKIDPERHEELSKHTWIYDGTVEVAYRLHRAAEGQLKVYLHREVMGVKHNDGTTIRFRDGNKLNCTKDNMYLGMKRAPWGSLPKKEKKGIRGRRTGNGPFFPSSAENFRSFVSTNYPGTPIDNFLEVADIKTFTTKEVVFTVEEGMVEDTANIHTLKPVLRRFLSDNFRFDGEVFIAVERKPARSEQKPVAAAAMAAPTAAPAIAPQIVPSTSPIPAALFPLVPSSPLAPTPAGEPLSGMALAALVPQLCKILGFADDVFLEELTLNVRRRSTDELHTYGYTYKIQAPERRI